MRPSVILNSKQYLVRATVSRYRTANPRVFGSVAHGTGQDGSDIDLLVDIYLVYKGKYSDNKGFAAFSCACC